MKLLIGLLALGVALVATGIVLLMTLFTNELGNVY